MAESVYESVYAFLILFSSNSEWTKPVFILMFDILVHVTKKPAQSSKSISMFLPLDPTVILPSWLLSLGEASFNLGDTKWITPSAKPQLLPLCQDLH